MTAEFIQPGAPRWNQFLERTRHDIYHTGEYVSVAARQENAQPIAFYAEHGEAACLLPLLLRTLPDYLEAPAEWLDATSPYGYPGPLLTAGVSPALIRGFVLEFRRVAAEAGIISAFIRSHPLIPLPAELADAELPCTKQGQTVYIDLRRPDPELWSETRANHRSQIRRLQQAGFVPVLDDWRWFPQFISLYTIGMQRAGADSFYFFPERYFLDLRDSLGPSLHLACVLAPGGGVAAAGLFTLKSGILQYHLGSSSEQHRAQAPSKLLFHFMRQWAPQQGATCFHLGGGLGCAQDSLFRFKAGFSKHRAEYRTWRLVISEDRYAVLRQRAQLAASGQYCDWGYFPQYRVRGRQIRAVAFSQA